MTGNLTQLLSFASVMKSIGGVVLAVVILLAMVTIHEFGHYLAGKALNFKINEFSVGFGPALFKKRNKKTGELFALRLIPLGGYCAFEGRTTRRTQARKRNPRTARSPSGSRFPIFRKQRKPTALRNPPHPPNGSRRRSIPKRKGKTSTISRPGSVSLF